MKKIMLLLAFVSSSTMAEVIIDSHGNVTYDYGTPVVNATIDNGATSDGSNSVTTDIIINNLNSSQNKPQNGAYSHDITESIIYNNIKNNNSNSNNDSW